MFVQTVAQSPRNHRGNQVSYLLLAKGQFGSESLAITWVEGRPNSEQPLHAHPTNEQVYVIVRGRGLMGAAGEEREVTEGTLVFLPPGTNHAIRNTGDAPLVFVSATSPPFDVEKLDPVFAYEAAAKLGEEKANV